MGALKDEDQLTDEIIKIAKGEQYTCELHLYCCTEKTDDPINNCVCYYTLLMTKNQDSGSIIIEKDRKSFKKLDW